MAALAITSSQRRKTATLCPSVHCAVDSQPPTFYIPIPVAWSSPSSPLPLLPPSSLWPAHMDLLVRAYVTPNFFLLRLLFQNIDLMWPKGVGTVILVLDEHDHVVHHMLPHGVKVREGGGLSRRGLQHWVKVRGGSTARRSWRGLHAQ